mgnify:CR=1 FL=1
MADVVADGLVMEPLLFEKIGKAHDGPHQAVIVRDMLQAVVVAIQGQAHHSEHQDVPEIHPGASGLLLIADDSLFEQRENLLINFRGSEDPLQAGQHGREFVAALVGNGHLLDRGLTKLDL